MNTIRVSREFTFEAAHMLEGHDGACKNLHGHSYKLTVTLRGKPLKDDHSPKNGMLIDFKIMGDLVKREVIDPLDHALICKAHQFPEISQKKYILEQQPTCENLIIEIANKIKNQLPENVQLVKLKLHETAKNYCEWLLEDNLSER
jgi:6-pyruvoyltetrahydropterin/6-carboxytetrahydropterin synthase